MTRDLHEKLRLELILEKPALRRAEKLLGDGGVTGWTVLPALAGSNGTRRWSRGQDLSASTDMVMLVCVADEATLMPRMTELHALLERHIGVLNIMRVQVLRDAEF